MSYPFSALERFNIPGETKEEARVYSVAYMVYSTEEAKWILDSFCFYLLDGTVEDAERRTMQWLQWKYTECDGYLKHQVKGSEVSANIFVNAGLVHYE